MDRGEELSWPARLGRLGMYRLPHWRPLAVPARGDAPGRAFLFAAFLAGALVLINTFPPMVDMPQHAAQVATFLRMMNGTEPWAEVYRINWLTPYWVGYALTALLAMWLPTVTAIKLVISLAVTMTAISAAYLRRETGGSAHWDWIFLPIGFGFAFDWGFLNFMVATPLALAYLALTINYLRSPGAYRAITIAIASVMLLLCHVLIVIFACALGALLAGMAAGSGRRALRICAPFMAPAPLVFLWWLLILTPEVQAQSPSYWNISLMRISEVIAFAAGQQNCVFYLPLTALAIGAPFAFGATCAADKRWCMPFLLFLIWMFFGPHQIFDNYFTYQRFGIFFLPMLVLALRPGVATHRLTHGFMPILGIALLIPIAYRLYAFEQESADFREVEKSIPAGGRLLAAIIDRDSQAAQQPSYLHFGAWYSARGPGMHEFSFASFVPEIIRFKEGHTRPLVVRGQDWFPSNYTHVMMRDFDYLLVRKEISSSPPPRKFNACQMSVLARSGNWSLYQNKHTALVSAAPLSCYYWH